MRPETATLAVLRGFATAAGEESGVVGLNVQLKLAREILPEDDAFATRDGSRFEENDDAMVRLPVDFQSVSGAVQ